MPIMAPLADVLGITRQTAIVAFQFGDGFTDSIIPTSAELMAYSTIAKIPYTKWPQIIQLTKAFKIHNILKCLLITIKRLGFNTNYDIMHICVRLSEM